MIYKQAGIACRHQPAQGRGRGPPLRKANGLARMARWHGSAGYRHFAAITRLGARPYCKQAVTHHRISHTVLCNLKVQVHSPSPRRKPRPSRDTACGPLEAQRISQGVILASLRFVQSKWSNFIHQLFVTYPGFDGTQQEQGVHPTPPPVPAAPKSWPGPSAQPEHALLGPACCSSSRT